MLKSCSQLAPKIHSQTIAASAARNTRAGDGRHELVKVQSASSRRAGRATCHGRTVPLPLCRRRSDIDEVAKVKLHTWCIRTEAEEAIAGCSRCHV